MAQFLFVSNAKESITVSSARKIMLCIYFCCGAQESLCDKIGIKDVHKNKIS